MMDLSNYRNITFDYEDFITHKIFQIEYNLQILEDFWFMYDLSYCNTIIRECNVSLMELRMMSQIPKKKLDKLRERK